MALGYIDRNVEVSLSYRYKYRARNINGWGNFSDFSYLFAASVP